MKESRASKVEGNPAKEHYNHPRTLARLTRCFQLTYSTVEKSVFHSFFATFYSLILFFLLLPSPPPHSPSLSWALCSLHLCLSHQISFPIFSNIASPSFSTVYLIRTSFRSSLLASRLVSTASLILSLFSPFLHSRGLYTLPFATCPSHPPAFPCHLPAFFFLLFFPPYLFDRKHQSNSVHSRITRNGVAFHTYTKKIMLPFSYHILLLSQHLFFSSFSIILTKKISM